ncbi:MAG: helix-turn-helix transcriptional regulator [Lachnospiraceae bacterium]|nr:helix-turn-helix transcriptional regulator [Lachnospiraceae bacterium]
MKISAEAQNYMVQHYRIIGLNIAYYRKLRGLTQLQLAERIDISRTHMSNIEAPNMPTSVSLEVLLLIAKELQISAYRLLVFPEE